VGQDGASKEKNKNKKKKKSAFKARISSKGKSKG
jgi:hypothetical protein